MRTPTGTRFVAPWRGLLGILAGTLLILSGWNWFAARFAGSRVGARGSAHVLQDASGNDDLGRALQQLDSGGVPRILILGSSQIHAVKGDSDFSDRAIPFRVSTVLGQRWPRHRVLDLSGPAQQVLESTLIALGGQSRIKPSIVVLGVGLFNMSNSDIRPALRGAIDLDQARRRIASLDGQGAVRHDRDVTLKALGSEAGVVDSTVQQRTDARIDRWLSSQLPMIANRRAMYNELIDQPLRRDLVAFVQGRRRGLKTARTYEFTPQYDVARSAIRVLAASLTSTGIPLIVCIMPTEHTREPVPYSVATRARVARDLREMARQSVFRLVDLDDALLPMDFSEFADGSPDGLHFDARGHAVVGLAIAKAISESLGHAP